MARGEADGIGGGTRSWRLSVSAKVAAALELGLGDTGTGHPVL